MGDMAGFKVNRADLLATLARVQPGLATTDQFEQSSSYVFQDGWLATFNGEIACRTKTDLPTDLVGAVRAKPLYAALERTPDHDVTITVRGGEFRVHGEVSGTRAGVRMESEILLPIEVIGTPDQWYALPDDFGAALRLVGGTVSTNTEEFVTTCVHVHPDWLETCDRYRVTRYEIPTGVSRPFLVRAKSLKQVVPLDMTRVGEAGEWVHFRNQRVLFSVRRHLEDFPDMTGFLGFRGTSVALPKGAEIAAKVAAAFSESGADDDKVTVTLENDTMLIRGDGAFGWAERPLPCTYNGAPLSFRIAPDALVELVKAHDRCEIGPGRLRVDGERWVYIAALGKAGKNEPKRDNDDVNSDAPEPAAEDGADADYEYAGRD